jgi:SAM-dependent methyltransferase
MVLAENGGGDYCRVWPVLRISLTGQAMISILPRYPNRRGGSARRSPEYALVLKYKWSPRRENDRGPGAKENPLTQQESYSSSAQAAYDAFAPVYDRFNEQNDYEVWLGEVLLPELEKHRVHRLPGGRLRVRALDVGCGTGRAFGPLVRRSWEVTGCDVSPEMLNRAHQKQSEMLVALYECDARDLPRFPGQFDLILALNDVVNYLTEDGDLERCFSGVAKNLAPHGLVCFDANTLGLFRSNFGGVRSESMSRGEWTWEGQGKKVIAGGAYEAKLSGPGIEAHVHRQRHWNEEDVRGAMETSGLTCLARLGQREEEGRIVLSESVDEERDVKVIYIGGHRGE